MFTSFARNGDNNTRELEAKDGKTNEFEEKLAGHAHAPDEVGQRSDTGKLWKTQKLTTLDGETQADRGCEHGSSRNGRQMNQTSQKNAYTQ